MSRLYRLARPALLRIDPERAHRLSIGALRSGLVPASRLAPDPRLETKVAGKSFANPLGLAAGYDKNGEVPDAALRLGFGFVEIGTVTPLPQTGNERPRIFRLPEAHAVINRFGFNSEGEADVAERLVKRSGRQGLVGVNVGANKNSPDRLADFVSGVHRFHRLASYVTVNVSSPNTPGLRELQGADDLRELLARVMAARDGAAAVEATPPCPIFLKVAPDLSEGEIEAITKAALEFAVDALIVSNTTLSRQGVERRRHANEAGGLSGRPLLARSTYVLAAFRKALGPAMPLVGAGGVESARTAIAKIEAGADLVQLYTAMIYHGPSLPARILGGMSRFLDKAGLDSFRSVRDSKVEEILERGLPAG